MTILRLSDIEDLADFEGFSTSLKSLDEAGYLRRDSSDLVFLGGRPGSGKTMLALQIAKSVAQNDPVLFFSLEMTARELKKRLVKQGGALRGLKLLICDQAGMTAEDIENTVLEQHAEIPLSLIVIDYVQIVQAMGRSKAEEVGSVVRRLKELAKEINVPILMVAQLSREIDKRAAASEFAEPQMSDFADSSEIERWADCALMLHRVPKTQGIIKLFCAKFRHGAPTNFELEFNYRTLKFSDVGSSEEETYDY